MSERCSITLPGPGGQYSFVALQNPAMASYWKDFSIIIIIMRLSPLFFPSTLSKCFDICFIIDLLSTRTAAATITMSHLRPIYFREEERKVGDDENLFRSLAHTLSVDLQASGRRSIDLRERERVHFVCKCRSKLRVTVKAEWLGAPPIFLKASSSQLHCAITSTVTAACAMFRDSYYY